MTPARARLAAALEMSDLRAIWVMSSDLFTGVSNVGFVSKGEGAKRAKDILGAKSRPSCLSLFE